MTPTSAPAGRWGGLGGALIAYSTPHASPDLSFWSYSGFVVIGVNSTNGFLICVASRALNPAAYCGSTHYPGAYDLATGGGLLATYAARKYATGR